MASGVPPCPSPLPGPRRRGLWQRRRRRRQPPTAAGDGGPGFRSSGYARRRRPEAPASEAPADGRARPRRPSRCRPTTARPRPPQPLADGEPIKIGFIGPQTGPLAAFGVIGQGMKVYFDKMNADGGIDGHPIEVITKDDAYDPAKSAPAVQEAIEGDKIFASVFQVGTPNVAGTRQLLRRRLRAAGAGRHRLPELGRSGQLPVDHGRHPVLHGRGERLDRVHQGEVPGRHEGRAADLQQRLRQDLPEGVRDELLPAAGLEIVADVVHEPTSDLSQRGHPAAGGRTRTSSSAGRRRRSAPA